ncbi:hypothetical protein K493DRAFT_360551 [Basidiobolus meristosporus CBS 931.73]|uniref:Uncharacterized protein n=1 Tax=Basidiobolus meristosporus CBS 931.73 TaxID=1314790 RepID=A0A1Y1XGM6_9FUNG|nr:hypothetical protein K493DRAFT_360551 [Basidiobolus meristosporus CBS 931.73]|eukprot:ORX84910.1 hypothetical protein K493DRAFT_360551 [Basidiobolus meristosporus CBS 931.73]
MIRVLRDIVPSDEPEILHVIVYSGISNQINIPGLPAGHQLPHSTQTMDEKGSRLSRTQALLHPSNVPACILLALCFPLISFLLATFVTFAVVTTASAAAILSVRFGLLTMSMSWTMVVEHSIHYSERCARDVIWKNPSRAPEPRRITRRRRRSNSQ